jgi:lipopolysaccharide/colanic/teichoic acid biosynthesis glycosyltransferase
MSCCQTLEERVRPYSASLDTGWRRVQLFVKRCLDFVLAAVGLVVLSPLVAVLILLIRFDSPGPAIYAQRRIGRFGRVFTIYKLRSMQHGCPVELNADGSTRVVENDSRVTRLGKNMRRYGLDELPQLVNIIRGDMSLVGPRPEQDFHLQWYRDGDFRKLSMRPGLTSLGQVSGRNGLPWEIRTVYEIEYVEKFSLWLDARIVWRTFEVILKGIGTYNPSPSRFPSPVAPERRLQEPAGVASRAASGPPK